MFVKKTNIVLGEKNFKALELAKDFLKEVFDPYAIPICSTIKGKGNKYRVLIGFESERIAFDEKTMVHCAVEIVFQFPRINPTEQKGLYRFLS